MTHHTAHQQRRDPKPYAVDARRGHPASPAEAELRRIVKLDPVQIARWWATSVASGDVDDAAAVYADDATVRLDGAQLGSRRAISRALDRLAICRTGRHPDDVDATGADIVVTWRPRDGDDGLRARMSIADGEIVDQDLIEHHDERATPGPDEEFPIEIVRRGRIAPGAVELAVEKVRTAARLAGAPVRSARVKLRQHPDPAATAPSVAEASLDLDGEVVRAGVSGAVMADTVDRLGHRLEDRLRHRREHQRWVRPTGVEPEPGEWRHGNLPTVRPPWFERPPEERQVIRHKTWEGEDASVDEAVFDMERLDHTFHLFRNVATGADTLVDRADDDYVLSQIGGASPDAVAGAATPITVDPTRPPTLSLTGAIERMNVAGDRHLLFEDRDSGRGMVLYRRLDGHYGLVTPAG